MRLSLIGKERWRGKFDGWQEDEELPSNWFYKPDKSSTNVFLDDLGNFYRYGLLALKSATSEDVQAQLKKFMKKTSPLYNKGKSLDDSWTINSVKTMTQVTGD